MSEIKSANVIEEEKSMDTVSSMIVDAETTEHNGDQRTKSSESQSGFSEKARRRLAVGLTIAATALANVAAGLPRVVEVEVPVGKGENNPSKAKAEPAETLEVSSERWARLFSKDPEAGDLTSKKELEKVGDRVERILQNGDEIKRIVLQGYSSDEDDGRDEFGQRTGGIQEKSLKNEELALKRATVFEELLVKDLQKRGIEIPDIEVAIPVEDLLSDQELKRVDKLTQKYGYSDIESMISSYNRQGGVPEEVNIALDEMLASERKVEVTIYTTGNEGVQSNDGNKNTIKLPLPLFLIIPILRRRKDEGFSAPPSMIPDEPLESLEEGRQPPKIERNNGPDKPVHAKDSRFRRKPLNGHYGHKPFLRELRIQPRPHNQGSRQTRFHGRKRDRGGSTRATR